MELRIFILSMACLSCLVPPALSTGVLATAAAVKGAAVLGAGALAAKGALIAKGALLAKGVLGTKLAAVTAAKVAAVKGAALVASGAAAKGLALGGATIAARTNVVATLTNAPAPTLVRAVTLNSLPLPSLKNTVSAVVGATKSLVDFKSSIISRLLGAIKANVDAIPEPQPVVYQIVSPAQPIYRRPVLELIEIDDKKKK